jgi:hypothetical protein
MTSLLTKMVDGKGRVTLGKEFAGRLVIVTQVGVGTLQVTRAEAVPERESWLYKNPEALRMVLEGTEQARGGQFTDGPDLSAGQKLADEIEG